MALAMSISQAVELLVAINLLVTGLSHLLQPKIWIEFFEFLHKKGNTGNLFNGMLSLGFGSFIVSFHFIWNWPEVLVTIYGLLLTIKGLIYLCFPKMGIKSIGKINSESGNKFRIAGVIMIVFAGWIVFRLSTI